MADAASSPVTWTKNLRPRDNSGGPGTSEENRCGEWGDGYNKIAPVPTIKNGSNAPGSKAGR